MDTYSAIQELQAQVATLRSELNAIRNAVEDLEAEVFGVQPGGEDGTDWDEIGDAEEEDYLVFTPEGGEPVELDDWDDADDLRYDEEVAF